jgi:large subunit ribosomal protein L18e
MSKNNRPPMSISRIAQLLKGKEGKVAVLVGTVTDDVRLAEVPKMTICALRFTETARARIVKAGGACMTFDQLALQDPKGSNTLLVRGKRTARKSYKYFGNPKDGARPFVRSKGRKQERARGRRRSCGFKL